MPAPNGVVTRSALAIAVGALACAGPAPRGEPLAFSAPAEAGPADDFQPVGGVAVPHGVVTSYDAGRIYTAGVSISFNEDREWTGELCGGHVVILRPEPGRLFGWGAELRFERRGAAVVVEGRLVQRPVYIEVGPGRIEYRFGTLHRWYAEKVPACFGDVHQPRDECAFLLEGDAAGAARARMPHLALALLATFCPPELLRP